MFDIGQMLVDAITKFFSDAFNGFVSFFAEQLANIMSTSLQVLDIPLVQNGIRYAQALAITILVIKTINEVLQTYILHEAGDPDQDPQGLVIRTGQAVAIIATLPDIVKYIFQFGTKVANDVANLGTGQMGIADFAYLTALFVGSDGLIVVAFAIIMVVMFLVIAIQATIRGAELALMAVLGPFMALNLSSNNRAIWSSWFKQVIIICVTQALQIFMLQGAFSLATNQAISSAGLLLQFGWLWVAIKSPKYVQQFAYSTGFTGAVGGTVKQAGTMAVMRRMMAR